MARVSAVVYVMGSRARQTAAIFAFISFLPVSCLSRGFISSLPNSLMDHVAERVKDGLRDGILNGVWSSNHIC